QALYCCSGYICIIIAIILLAHPALGQTSFKYLKHPMILVSYYSIDPLSSSIAKKVKERLSLEQPILLGQSGFSSSTSSSSSFFSSP
ncbi:uncharacterized protein BDZ99DRAFT_556602, partial [Mytilinidion resinicola]